MEEKIQEVEKGCSNDACFHVKKTILAVKEVIEAVLQDLGNDYPGMSMEKTFEEENGQIIPKIGIFPSTIITLPATPQIPQPLRVMIFINVLNAKEQEIDLSYGWTFGPEADQEKEEVYVKLLEVVAILKEEKGSLYRGKLKKEALEPLIKKLFAQIIEEYQSLLEDLGLV